MAPSTKRRAADELDSSPTTKRQRTEAPTSPQEALVLSSPAPRRASRTPIRRSATPTAPVVSASPDDSDLESDIDSDTESGDDALLERIQAGVEYTRAQQRPGEAVKQTTRFTLSTDTPSRALSLLRRYGTLIVSAADFEEYELAVPRPDGVKQGILPGLHDPQCGGEEGSGAFEGPSTKKDKKKGPTAREKEIDWKLMEGLRRQEAGEKMYDDDDDDDSEDEEDEEGSGSESENGDEDGREDKVEENEREDGDDGNEIEEESSDEEEYDEEVSVRSALTARKRVRFVILDDSDDE